MRAVPGTGEVVSLHIAYEKEAPTRSVDRVRAFPGRGLEGDRYFLGSGTYSDPAGPDREVTLIEMEAIEALRRDAGLELAPGAARRNIVVRGTALNHLVGRDFQVGEVRMRGVRLCEPCAHLESLTRKGVLGGLVHRGGLRAQILSEGTIRVGDMVVVADPASPPSMEKPAPDPDH